jgi:hypothetical protein
MKHLQTYTLYENKKRQDLESELKYALEETRSGKDLLAINKITGMASESWKTWVRFSNVKRKGDMIFPTVESMTNSGYWSWGYRPVDGHSTQYFHGGDFSDAEGCLRSLWMDLITLPCDEIFPDSSVRKEHADLIRSNISLFEGHAYNLDDIGFIITHLKEILSSRVSPNVAGVLRQRFPAIWQTLNDNPGATTSADLGELGF